MQTENCHCERSSSCGAGRNRVEDEPMLCGEKKDDGDDTQGHAEVERRTVVEHGSPSTLKRDQDGKYPLRRSRCLVYDQTVQTDSSLPFRLFGGIRDRRWKGDLPRTLWFPAAIARSKESAAISGRGVEP